MRQIREALTSTTGLKRETIEDLSDNGWSFVQRYNEPLMFVRDSHLLKSTIAHQNVFEKE